MIRHDTDIVSSLEDDDDQILQYILTDAEWKSSAVMVQVAREADQSLGGSDASRLLLDESSFTKKDKHSVGVAR